MSLGRDFHGHRFRHETMLTPCPERIGSIHASLITLPQKTARPMTEKDRANQRRRRLEMTYDSLYIETY